MNPGWATDGRAAGHGLSRRDFLKTAAWAAAAGAGAFAAAAQSPTGAATKAAASLPPGRVVRVFGADAVAANKINAAVAEKMVNLAVMRLQGKNNAAAAWRDLFSAKDVVGIKVNSMGGPLLSTSRAVVAAIINALTGLGVPENNIIIWDGPKSRNYFSGYKVNSGPAGLRCVNADDFGYESHVALALGGQAAFTKLLTRELTALINTPVLKTHAQTGLTFALKNIAMGSIHQPSDHCTKGAGGTLHKSIASICAREEVRGKQRLALGDALLGLCAAGPGPYPGGMWAARCVAAARDPVALDAWGLATINAERQQRKLPPAGGGRGGWNNAEHLRLAAGLGVGSDQFALIEETVT